MKPIICATCGYFIGKVIIEYEAEVKKICDNIDLNSEQQSEAIVKVIKSLNIRRYCCKMRLFTQKDIVYDILPISTNVST